MQFTLAQVVQATGAEFSGDATALATGWSIDSRTLSPGDLFFAINAGHSYVPDVLARGAVAAVVSEPASGNVLRVPDTIAALQQLASFARDKWNGDVIGVTGSAGKTSTKDIIHALLSVGVIAGKTVGNFNNHLGLPLSILRLPENCAAAVLEMGMNHAGEIRALARIARPRIGVVTNVGYAHVENFEGIDGVAAAKRELIDELPPEGIAILNADDERVSRFRAPYRILFGFAENADVRAEDVSSDGDATRFRVRNVLFETALQGRHSVRNILAGLAVAELFGIALEKTVSAVAALRPSSMRGERYLRNGILILNDSYNANPEAMRCMLDVLRAEKAARRIAVLGEMRELGHHSFELHRQVGAYAAQTGVDVLIAVAGDARGIVEGAHLSEAHYFQTPEEAGDFLKANAREGDAILFKGSRGTHVEKAIARMEL